FIEALTGSPHATVAGIDFETENAENAVLAFRDKVRHFAIGRNLYDLAMVDAAHVKTAIDGIGGKPFRNQVAGNQISGMDGKCRFGSRDHRILLFYTSDEGLERGAA